MEDINESTQPVPSNDDFAVGDVVLAFHGNLLYEARVLHILREKENSRAHAYTVHYQGWKKSWDETVPSNLVYEHNNDNLRVAHRLLNGAKQRQQAVSTTEEKKTSEKTLPPSSPPNAIFQIPPALQRQLVDDWEFITKDHRLVPLPRNPTVESVLQKWVSNRRQTSDKATKEVAEALQTYFDAALSKLLLYRFERQQYVDFFHNKKEAPPLPSAVYGAEHLLRLLHKLPYMLESTAVDKEKMQAIAERANELAKYMLKNGRILFLTEYTSASSDYVARCTSM